MQRPIEQRYAARRSIEKLLRNPKWKKTATNTIAQHLGMSWSFVDQIRHKLDSNIPKYREDCKGVLRPATKESKFSSYHGD